MLEEGGEPRDVDVWMCGYLPRYPWMGWFKGVDSDFSNQFLTSGMLQVRLHWIPA